MQRPQVGNAEGYCRKCHHSLDISGQCAVCAMEDLPHVKEFPPCKFCGQTEGVYYELIEESYEAFRLDDRSLQWHSEIVENQYFSVECPKCLEKWTEEVE